MGGIMAAGFAPFVQDEQREQWEAYAIENQDWIERSAYLRDVHPIHTNALKGTIQDHESDRRRVLQEEESISGEVFRWVDGTKQVEERVPGKVYAPLWQVAPATYSSVNANILSDPRIKQLYDVMVKADRAVLSQNLAVDDMFDYLFSPEEKPQKKLPHAYILMPVYNDFVEKEQEETVGVLLGVTVYTNIFDRLLPEGTDGIIAVLDDSCGNTMSFELNSGKAEFLGYGDVHESEFDRYERYEVNLERYENPGINGLCVHDLRVYPSSKFRATFETNHPAVYAGVVGLAFLGTAFIMLLYDFLVNRRQSKTVKIAARTQAIVTSLFPKEIGKKIVAQAVEEPASAAKGWKIKTTTKKKDDGEYGSSGGDMNNFKSSKPMADLFPEATVMFGDIVGFTAWASTREPTQVFQLLESMYSAFDKIALRRRVMKIETVGDCYVAVCGLPDPRRDHATVMVRFARDCLDKMYEVLHELTVTLGPDTDDLGIRIGLNSGPVTAGVLRGDRARFQLFGDTVNTTARVEASGAKNRIHISESTAKLLIEGGKESWVTLRNDKVNAKGKGEMQTYWVHTTAGVAKSVQSTGTSDLSVGNQSFDLDPLGQFIKTRETNKRVIDWIVALLTALLKDVIARRQTIGVKPDPERVLKQAEKAILMSSQMPMDEVKEVITLPKFKETDNHVDSRQIQLSSEVTAQLRLFVTSMGNLYNDNPFHNFEHANHVTMSVVKLLKRIVAPTDTDTDLHNLHDHTYGITSDPLTQFSVVIAALIHDVDHDGVPNAQLIDEETQAALMYNGKSVAEQNSIDLSWHILMEDQYEALRHVIYTTTEELRRFRQMVVHTVMATDIFDKESNQKRKDRWFKTFPDRQLATSPKQLASGSSNGEVDRKATIVIEHLMQASDVAHTMQHWHVYSKWNGRLFKEMYKAYKEGRGKDPSKNWYEGEISFLDFYVIPLAKKLQRCGVFGVFGDDYLNYARENRKEWVEKGKDIVANLLRELEGPEPVEGIEEYSAPLQG